MELEEILIELHRFGFPNVFCNKDGWRVSVDVHVNATGAKFDVGSDFKHHSPSSAASECLQRVQIIMRGFGGSPLAVERKP